MTFILNILHKDMAILAADNKGTAFWKDTWGFKEPQRVETELDKVTINKAGNIAIGVAGYSPHNSYLKEFDKTKNSADALLMIRKHMEDFLMVNDVLSLIQKASPFVNESIVSFYDEATQTFLSNEFHFNEYTNKTHLHRASEDTQVFCAGSGREYFDIDIAKEEIQSVVHHTNSDDLQEAFISWIKEAFIDVSSKDDGCGSEASIAISTRANQNFQLIKSC